MPVPALGVASSDLGIDFQGMFQGSDASLASVAAGFVKVSETIDNELQRTMVRVVAPRRVGLVGVLSLHRRRMGVLVHI